MRRTAIAVFALCLLAFSAFQPACAQPAPASSPSSAARAYTSMTYDAARGTIVLFGGSSLGTASVRGRSLAETWTWSASAGWTQQHPPASPPALEQAGIAYDAARQQAVLFGGRSCSGTGPCVDQGDTWTWDGATWTRQSPAASPSARHGGSMTYDAARRVVLLFGGCCSAATQDRPGLVALADARTISGNIAANSNLGVLNDTWSWDGTNWAQLQPSTSPDARDDGALAFDPIRGQVVLFGSIEALDPSHASTSKLIPDKTWLWDGSNWTASDANLQASTGRQFGGPSMAFDPTMGQIVLFGGMVNYGENLDSPLTFTWDGQQWTRLQPPANPKIGGSGMALAYDDADGRLVLYGGGQTWTWDGTVWTQVTAGT